MNAADIIGYAFDGAEYCIGCARTTLTPKQTNCLCPRRKLDENGLCAENCHGYGPNPIFGDSGSAGPCDVCGGEIVENGGDEGMDEGEPL